MVAGPPTDRSAAVGVTRQPGNSFPILALRFDARLRSAALDYRGTVRALAKAGDASEAAGLLSQASVHYLRAGRSALHQGARARARTLLTRARTLADQTGDAETAREAQLYLTLLEESEPEPASDR